MSRRVPFSLAALVLAASPALAGESYVVDRAHSEVLFQVRHLMSRVTGRFQDFSGAVRIDRAHPEASSVEFTIQAASVDTANSQRDTHLRSADFFDVEKTPQITFKSEKVVPKGDNGFEVTGPLTIRGVTKQVTLPVSYLGSARDPFGNERAGFQTAATLNRKEFGLVWNKALEAGGFLVGDDVSVTIDVEAVKQKDVAAR